MDIYESIQVIDLLLDVSINILIHVGGVAITFKIAKMFLMSL